MVMQPYSLDLRERVFETYRAGLATMAEIADQFGVSVSFVCEMVVLFRDTGALSPRAHGGGKPRTLSEQDERVIARILGDKNDSSLAELREELAQRTGKNVSASTMSRALKKMGKVAAPQSAFL